LEGLATSLGGGLSDSTEVAPPDPEMGFLGELGTVIGPMLMSLQIGSMLGHLAQRALGQYDPPLPRPASDDLTVVPANIDAFASDWSLPVDDLRLWVLVHEITYHCVLGRPHVRDRLHELLLAYVNGFQPDARALEEKLEGIDPMHPEEFQQALGDPETLLGVVQSDAQRDV